MQPIYLYKYCSNINPHHIKLLYNYSIYFSSVEQLNDPFEAKSFLRLDLLTLEEIKEFLLKVAQTQYDKDDISLNNEYVKRINDYVVQNKNYFCDKQKIREYQYNYVYKNFGIFSLTSNPKNLLMWSHYSNNHKGFCLRYNVNKAQNWYEEKYSKGKIVFEKIHYLGLPYDLTPKDYKNIIMDEVVKPLLYKPIVWEHEQEYRLISCGKNKYTEFYPPQILDGIILGANIEENFSHEIRNVHNKIEVLQARLDDDTFEIIFERNV